MNINQITLRDETAGFPHFKEKIEKQIEPSDSHPHQLFQRTSPFRVTNQQLHLSA